MKQDAARPISVQLSDNGAVRPQRCTVRRAWLLCRCILLALCLGYYCIGDVWIQALAHEHDRPDLDGWFNKLKSKNGGLCCDFTEAKRIADPDWDTKDGHYRVFLDGKWWDVPDNSVVTEPNRYGPALVWPIEYQDSTGKLTTYGIRCFMPGAGT